MYKITIKAMISFTKTPLFTFPQLRRINHQVEVEKHFVDELS